MNEDTNSQDYQARMVKDQVGATYTESDEEEKLRALFGEPDAEGIYRAPGR